MITRKQAWDFDDKVQAHEMIKVIEGDFDSFTEGRRNDDLINWALLYLYADDKCNDAADLIFRYRQMIVNLTKAQKHSLVYWDEDWEGKLAYCADNYKHLTMQEQKNLMLNQGGYRCFVDEDGRVHPYNEI